MGWHTTVMLWWHVRTWPMLRHWWMLFACADMVNVTPLWCWWHVQTWSMLRDWWDVMDTWSLLRNTWGGGQRKSGWRPVWLLVQLALAVLIIPQDLNVNKCTTKLGHFAGSKSEVSRQRFVSPRPVKCLRIDNSNEPLKNPEPCFCWSLALLVFTVFYWILFRIAFRLLLSFWENNLIATPQEKIEHKIIPQGMGYFQSTYHPSMHPSICLPS